MCAVTAADLQIRFSSDTKSAEAGIDRVGSKVKGLSGVMQTALGTAGGFLLGGAVREVIGGFGSLVKGALDFEAGMANVNSIAQLTDGQLKDLSASVNDLATDTAQAPQVLAAGLYDIYSSGFQGAEALDVLKASANAATAGLTTTDVAARAITSVMNAYGQETYSAAEVSDVLFQTVNDGVITFEQLANNMGNTLPMANALGIGIQQLGAAYAQMTLQGVNASAAETQIASLMKSAANPTDDLTAATQAYGYESTQALLAAEGMPGLLKAIDQAAGGNSETLYDLLGTQEAVNAATILGADGAKAYNDELERMEHAAGATNKALTQQAKSSAFAMKQAKVAFQQAATVLIGALSPAIQLAARGMAFLATDVLTPAVELFARIADPISRFVGLLGEVFGAGQGVSDLFNVLFGQGAAFRDAPQFVKELAFGLLEIADAFGDIWAAFRSGGLGGVADVIGEEVSNILDTVQRLAKITLNIVIDTAVDVIGEIRDLLQKGVLAFIGYAGYSTGDPMLRGLGGVGIGTGAPDLTIDIVVDGLVKLIGDLSDISGSIERELGLQRSEVQLQAANEAGKDVGRALADAIDLGISRGLQEGGAEGQDRGFVQAIKTILTWEPEAFRDDEATILDEAFAWATGVGQGVRAKITEGLSAAFNGTETTASQLNPFSEGPVMEGGVAGWLQGTADSIIQAFKDLPGDIASGVGTIDIDIPTPELPDWVSSFGWLTEPINALIGFIGEQIARIIGKFQELNNAKNGGGITNNMGADYGGRSGDPTFDYADLGAEGAQFRPAVTLLPEFDTSQVAGLADSALASVKAASEQTFTATFLADNSDVALKYTDVMSWGGIWEGSTFTGAFAADNGAVAVAYSEAFGWGSTWAAQTFTARFSVDTSGITAAVGVAQAAAAQIAAIMPHSPAREGPLSEPIKFDWIADEMRGAMARMGPAAEAGMGAVADRLGRGVGFDFAGRGVYGGDSAGGGTVSHSVTVNINAPVYGVDDLENVIVDTYMDKVMPAQVAAIKRRNRALGHQP